MKYAHGQHSAYVLDRCRCEPCKQANTAYEKNRAQRIEPAYVLASEARAHVVWLSTQGVGRKQIAKVTGVAHGTLCKLMFGDNARGSRPSKRIRRRTHEAIMAVTPADCGGNRKVISAAPTWALLDEMIAAGVPRSAIATALGYKAHTLQIKRTTVSPANRDRVEALHARWLAGDWLPVRRDRHGNTAPCPPRRAPVPVAVVNERRIERDIDRVSLVTALADAIDARVNRPWRHLAACRGRPSHMWFPQRGDIKTHRAAVKICNACPVRRECRLANLDERDGIYGGVGARARMQLRGELARHPDAGVMASEHGTTIGYRQHLKGGEEPCERCKTANADYHRELRRRRANEPNDTLTRVLDEALARLDKPSLRPGEEEMSAGLCWEMVG
jgi:hypothetical protein